MYWLETGTPYPFPVPKRDGLALVPTPDCLVGILHQTVYEPDTLKIFLGTIELGVALYETVPLVSLRFGGRTGLVVGAPLLLGNRPDLVQQVLQAREKLALHFVEGGDLPIVRSQRILTLSRQILGALQFTCQKQPSDADDLLRLAQEIQARYPTGHAASKAASLLQVFSPERNAG